MSFVDREMELILHQMEFPNFFISVDADWRSPLYIDESKIKLIDIMELVCGLFYLTGGVFRLDRKELFLTDVARMFEKLFNISFGGIHKKEEAVIKRKPEKMTDFLDRLKAVIIQKSKEKGYS